MSGYRTGDNPARWRGHLQNLLAKRSKVTKVEHHPALPYGQMGEFMAELRTQAGMAALALEFTILTAARTGEVIGARWNEIDLDGKVWTVPAERMKAEREHRVPLCTRAIKILKELQPLGGEFVFKGLKPGKPLSNMAMLELLKRMGRQDISVHGFRSAFRDWTAEQTAYPNEMAEMALAHTIGNKAEAAYRRGDLFTKRLRMMNDWAKHCDTIRRQGRRGKHQEGRLMLSELESYQLALGKLIDRVASVNDAERANEWDVTAHRKAIEAIAKRLEETADLLVHGSEQFRIEEFHDREVSRSALLALMAFL